MRTFKFKTAALFLLLLSLAGAPMNAQEADLPVWLQDRGIGVATSMFGTYIKEKEFMIYPFYEFYYDHNAAYKPSDFGFIDTSDFTSPKSIAHEGILFLGYGISSHFSVEMEAAVINESINKSPVDDSNMPDEYKESGLGDVEGQLRARWNNETRNIPEFFSYFETVLPLQPNRKLIGTQDWQFKLGSGILKGFQWGTLMLRAAVEYDAGTGEIAPGEYALEYMNRLSKKFQFSAIMEGSGDEISFIADLQWHVSTHTFIRFNNGFGLTPHAIDYTPEFGVLFHF
jgi:hypothetical protein